MLHSGAMLRALGIVVLLLGLAALRFAAAQPPTREDAPEPARPFPCPEDPALAEAALALLLEGATAPSAEALSSALRAARSSAPSARARVFPLLDEAGPSAWARSLAARADAPLFCGEADDGEHRLVLVAEIGGSVEAVGEPPSRLRVRVHPSLARPHLVLEDAEGRLSRLPVALRAGEGVVELPVDLALPLEVQLVAEGRRGPRPFAERVVGPAAADLGPSTDGDTDAASRVAALRAHHGASTLRPNRLIEAEANAHAARVCREGRAAHRLGDGDPEERLRRRGLGARVVGEAVARAATVPRALAALADSPSHLLTIVDRRFTDAGYGVSSDARGGVCVVVLLAAWPRPVPR